jgi:hypothetical protein
MTFVSGTTTVYNSATSYNPLNVYLSTTLTIQAGTVIVDQQNPITVTLKDQNGNALASRTVSIIINGVSYANLTTDSNGQASFNWSPSNTGNYTVAASYSATGPSDMGYESSSTSTGVTVKPLVIVNTQSTGSGTQSVTFQTAQGSAQPPAGLSVSLTFPSLGWTNLKITLNGQTMQGTLHVWNQFGANCVASVFGTCVMWLPYLHVHFDMATNLEGGAVSLVTDFLSGTVLSATTSFYGVPIPFDINSPAFNWGQNVGNLAFSASVTTYALTYTGSLGIAEAAAAPIAVATLWGVSFGGGIAGFLSYHDKTSRSNFFAGLAWAVASGIIGRFIDTYNLPTGVCNWPCILGSDFGWGLYWGILAFADPLSRVVLWTGWMTLLLASLEALLLSSTM